MRSQVIREVKIAPAFTKSYRLLPETIKRQADKKNILFQANAFDPRLRTHKLKGPLAGYWAYSVNYHYRVLFSFDTSDVVIYYDIGTHSIYK